MSAFVKEGAGGTAGGVEFKGLDSKGEGLEDGETRLCTEVQEDGSTVRCSFANPRYIYFFLRFGIFLLVFVVFGCPWMTDTCGSFNNDVMTRRVVLR